MAGLVCFAAGPLVQTESERVSVPPDNIRSCDDCLRSILGHFSPSMGMGEGSKAAYSTVTCGSHTHTLLARTVIFRT